MRSYCNTFMHSKDSFGSKESSPKVNQEHSKKIPLIVICSPRRKPYLSDEDCKSTPKAFRPFAEYNKKGNYTSMGINTFKKSISPSDILKNAVENVFISP